MLSGANPFKDPLSDLDSAVHTLASFLGGTISFAHDCPGNLDGQPTETPGLLCSIPPELKHVRPGTCLSQQVFSPPLKRFLPTRLEPSGARRRGRRPRGHHSVCICTHRPSTTACSELETKSS